MGYWSLFQGVALGWYVTPLRGFERRHLPGAAPGRAEKRIRSD
jgi:hypothetical protein